MPGACEPSCSLKVVGRSSRGESCGAEVAALTASGKKSESIGASARASKRVLDSSASRFLVSNGGLSTKIDQSLTESVKQGNEATSFVLRAQRQDRNIVNDDSVLREDHVSFRNAGEGSVSK